MAASIAPCSLYAGITTDSGTLEDCVCILPRRLRNRVLHVRDASEDHVSCYQSFRPVPVASGSIGRSPPCHHGDAVFACPAGSGRGASPSLRATSLPGPVDDFLEQRHEIGGGHP